jgi:hypothetical protein
MNKKIYLIGSVVFAGILAIGAMQFFTIGNSEGLYTKKKLGSIQEQSAEDALLWMKARYIDVTTGQPITPEKLAAIQSNFNKLPKEKSLVWQEQGPDNIGGRTRAIAINRNNPMEVWAGGVSGGLFYTSNAGNSWSRVTSYIDAGANPFISSMTMTKDGTLYVATGSNDESSVWNGNGVWYSTDLGSTWSKIPGTANCTEIESGKTSNHAWMATPAGLKKWQVGDAALTSVSGPSGGCFALKVSGDEQVIVAAYGSNKTYVSNDGGASFVDRSGTVANNLVLSNAPRIEYTISHERNSTGNYSLYAVRTNSNLLGMHVSHDNGETWTQFVGNPDIDPVTAGTQPPSDFDIYRDQGTYNTIVSVAPNDPEMILIGGIDVWRWKQTVNNPPSGGFRKISQWFVDPSSSIYVHADVHEMKWDDSDRFYTGSDGGVSISNNVDAANPDAIEWFVANRGYNVTQFYGIAFDKFGAVMGGTQDNGTLYNDHTMNTYQEFRQVNGGDGFECEISFFNEKIMFSSIYYNSISRSGDQGQTWTSFVPNLPGTYDDPGTEGNFHPFHTEFVLAENYDLNSEDSVTYIPKRDIIAGETIRVPSLSSGDTINFVAPDDYYFDAELNYDPSLTINGINYGINTATGETVEMGSDTIIYNVSWDTVRVQDPYQSWFLVYVNANGGELWGTRNATRFSVTNPQWVCVARGFGGGIFNNIDIEFTKDLEHCYVSAGTNGVWRIDGLGSAYSSDPNFISKVGYVGTGVTATTPSYTTATKITSTGYEGIALNPNDDDDLLLLPGFSGSVKRANNASSATLNGVTSTTLGSVSGVACYDGIIDRDNPDIIVLGTSNGVLVSSTGGIGANPWTNSSLGFEGTPVYEVRQSWRTWEDGNGRPGEIYIGTFGRGIWSSASYLGINENSTNTAEFKTKLKAYPNPTNDNTSISFKLVQNGNVDLAVYSISGKLVKTISKKNLSAGDNNIFIDCEDIPNGTYIVKLVSGKQVESVKFIKM